MPQRIGDDEMVCVAMSRRQAMVLEVWLMGRGAKLGRGDETMPVPAATYVVTPPGVELDLRRVKR
jgi:hypothetical protein